MSPASSASDHSPLPAPGASQTDWSMIYDAAYGPEEHARAAWDQLARRYWPAIFAYIRSHGRDVHQASDLTQGFVCDIMLGRRLLKVADPRRGRFRTLLLTALKNYITERHRADTRRKRAPADGQILELDGRGGAAMAPASADTPEAVFIAQWSAMLVQRVLDRVRRSCEEEGLDRHWAVFDARVARPMLTGEAPVSYAALVERLGVRDAAQAANMMITVKRRFARMLFEEVAQTVEDPADVEDELRVLMRALERPT